ncbi:hypothetical protein [uncultured Porticoccus sp.]|uniref:hypothetical protein n=1 Tax=uncultured Porticoccus sp. TaxID=1256050 RepID=UPI00261F15D7|nr:hypothetical protein [uncultured Porticoccus sp.]
MCRIDSGYHKNGTNQLLFLVVLAACSIAAGCAATSTDTSVGSAQSNNWHGLFIDDMAEKLPTPDSVTELPGGGKTYRWTRTETVETLSYSNYKRSVQATCIFQVTTAPDTSIKNVVNRGHEQVCQYFTDKL